MKKNLFIMLVASMAAMFTGCSKDDDAGQGSAFNIQVMNQIIPTRKIPVHLSVRCDTKPVVTFSTEGDALGVVTLTYQTEFDTEYIYANELIDVQFDNGTATAMFWYIPLTAGDHGVNFTIDYTQNGVAKTETSSRVLTVLDSFSGGFEPEIIGLDDGTPAPYIYTFRNSPKSDKTVTGCDFRIAVKSFEGNATAIQIEKAHIVVEANENEFYPIQSQSWEKDREAWKSWTYFYVLAWNEQDQLYHVASGPITFSMICRDDYNRCRDIVVTTDANGEVVSAELSDYYLWRNRK